MAPKKIRWFDQLLALPHRRYLSYLALSYAVFWLLLGYYPVDRSVWLLENALVLVVVIGIAASCRHLPLSRISYTLNFIFL